METKQKSIGLKRKPNPGKTNQNENIKNQILYINDNKESVFITPETMEPIDRSCSNTLCCMTLYNEPAGAVLFSLRSMVNNIVYLNKENFQEDIKQVTLCLIADGLDCISESTKELLSVFGLFKSTLTFYHADMFIFDNHVSSTAMYSLIDHSLAEMQHEEKWEYIYQYANKNKKNDGSELKLLKEQYSIDFRILLCVKNKNKGKLDSHWWFFKVLCQHLQPEYCIQMDIGTSPRFDAAYHFINRMVETPDAGAVTSPVLIDNSSNPYNLLQLWQFGDFAVQKLMEWPAEILSGYLTVIPGQFSMFRWAAISNKNYNNKSGQFINENQVSNSPLNRYLRGLEKLGPFESNMFLGEDRILGYEIISQKKKDYFLSYVPDAVAVADSCETVEELFQQRRRWSNSNFTCNVWLISKIGNCIKNSNAGILKKLHILLSVPWLGVKSVLQYLLPSLILILYNVFLDQVSSNSGDSSIFVKIIEGSYYGFIFLLAFQVILFFKGPINKFKKIIIYLSGFIQSALFLAAIVYGVADGFKLGNSKILPFLFFLEPLILLFLARIDSKKMYKGFRNILFQYIVLRPVMALEIGMYSFCQLHNCSWGTKGLNYKNQKMAGKEKRKFHWFRNIFMFFWLMINIGFIISFSQMGIETRHIVTNAVVSFFLYMLGFKVFSGFVLALKKKQKRTKMPD